MQRKIEIKQLVSQEQVASQLALTNRSAASLCEEVGAAHAMMVMQIFEGQTLHFPHASTVLKASIVAYIRKELDETYKGRKDRRTAVKHVQRTLDELRIHLARQQIERIFKAKKWVQ